MRHSQRIAKHRKETRHGSCRPRQKKPQRNRRKRRSPAALPRQHRRQLIAELDARPKDAPISELGHELRAIKQKYIENGGTFITSDEEFERVVRQYRYGLED